MNVAGKVVAITGAGGGIGRALARQFSGCGAQLALIDLQAMELDAISTELGGATRAFVADVADETAVTHAIEEIAGRFGRLDVLINNAGVTRDGLLLKIKDNQVAGKMSLSDWKAVIDVNLTGVFLCTRAAAEQMVICGNGGAIINISSVSRSGNIGQSNYSAAKAGVMALTVTWSKELARFGIRVGAIAPGFVRTDLVMKMRRDALERTLAAVPLNRLGEPEEVAEAARFIVESEFFTGRCIELDGGLRI